MTDGATDTAVAQPAVVWQSLAGLALLEQLGCEATAATGHSLGELTALAWAGSLSADDVLRLATRRARLMASHGVAGTGMLGLGTGAEHAQRLLAGTSAVVAAVNCPVQTVVAGARTELSTVEAPQPRPALVVPAELPAELATALAGFAT